MNETARESASTNRNPDETHPATEVGLGDRRRFFLVWKHASGKVLDAAGYTVLDGCEIYLKSEHFKDFDPSKFHLWIWIGVSILGWTVADGRTLFRFQIENERVADWEAGYKDSPGTLTMPLRADAHVTRPIPQGANNPYRIALLYQAQGQPATMDGNYRFWADVHVVDGSI